MTEQYITQNEDAVRGEENPKLLINIDTVDKQNILEKTAELMKKDNLPNPQNLRRTVRVGLKEKTKLVDEVIDSVQTSNITEDNKLGKCSAFVITQLLGVTEIKNKKKEEPSSKRKTESNINALCKDVCLIERWETGMSRKESQKTKLDHLYQVKRKGIKEQLKNLSNRLKQKLPL